MGSAPDQTRHTVPPARVAEGFVSVYYRVCADLPSRLPQLYGPDSDLHHGHQKAHGPAIADVAHSIPLAGKPVANIATLHAQRTASGGVVVSVVGTFVKDAANVVFAQTFVLEKQLDSHKDHFYCRNDLFVEVVDAVLPGVPPEFGKEIVDRELAAKKDDVDGVEEEDDVEDDDGGEVVKAAEEGVQNVDSDDDPDVEKVDKVLPVAVADEQIAEPSVSAVTENAHHEEIVQDHHHSEEEEHALDHPDANGLVQSAEQSDDDPADDVASEKSPIAEKSSVPDAAQNGNVEEDPVASPPPVKKTWASIVSAKEDAHKEIVDVHKSSEDVSVTRAIPDQVENIPPVDDAKQKTPSHHRVQTQPPPPPQQQQQQPPRQNSSVQNGHRPNHTTGRGGHQRTFGPSAIVHLSSLCPGHVDDPRALCSELRTEFGQYGYKVRHVEVKAQKGIAFIEYETSEGMRAAVAAWANGPRAEGVFAGVPLVVQEKRPYNHNYKWRPGNMRGGRGGGMRGGRRNRPASTPYS